MDILQRASAGPTNCTSHPAVSTSPTICTSQPVRVLHQLENQIVWRISIRLFHMRPLRLQLVLRVCLVRYPLPRLAQLIGPCANPLAGPSCLDGLRYAAAHAAAAPAAASCTAVASVCTATAV